MTDHDPNELFEALPAGTLLGRYQIVRVLGYGGMGAVYEGIHRDLKKRVAIKTLHPSVAALPAAQTRFLREGEAASRINHPNVVDVTDVGTENGITYLVMEFLEGEDLSLMLLRVGALPFTAAVDIMLAVVAAIAVAHDEGVIHRDLKPGNVFMAHTRHGGTKPTVLDFGISKLSAGKGTGNVLALTGTGASMGTPYYVAPEQIRSAAGADARSDQYALGAILYECVTGQRAHQGESVYDVIRSVGDGSFPPPRAYRPDIPPELEDAILRAMRLEPPGRFPTVRAFGRAIMPFASQAAREQWTPGLSTGLDGLGSPVKTLVAPTPTPGATPSSTPAPKAGGTVVMPPPDSGAAAKARTPASRSRPRSVPDTTFSASAAQMTPPRLSRGPRPGLVVGGFVLLVGGAAATYFMFAPPTRDRPRSAVAVTASATDPASASDPAPAPARPFRVKVVANPKTARISIDGRLAGTGAIDEELPADGAGHTLGVSADGFEPARFRFRDSPPPGEVTLERAAADPVSAKDETPAKDPVGKARASAATRPPRASSRGHERGRDKGGAADQRQTPPQPAAATPTARGANNAAIIE